MTPNKMMAKLFSICTKVTLLLMMVFIFTGCSSTGKKTPEELKFIAINENDFESQYKLSENYMKAFTTLFNTGDYKELLKYLPSHVQARNVRAMHAMMKRDMGKLGKIKDVKFVVRLQRHLMADFLWKIKFTPEINDKKVTMEYLYKIVIIKDKDGKNQIIKADFIFK